MTRSQPGAIEPSTTAARKQISSTLAKPSLAVHRGFSVVVRPDRIGTFSIALPRSWGYGLFVTESADDRARELTRRHDEIGQRHDELLEREAELATGRQLTEGDLKQAAQRAHEAHEHSREVHRRVLSAHAEAAVAHQRAAAAHELAVEEGLGDPSVHQRAAQKAREAAHRELDAVEALRRHAE